MADDWVRRRPRPLRKFIAFGLFVGIVAVAAVGTYRVVDEVRDPARACARQLPPFEGLQLTSVHRHWTPPIVRCSYVAASIDLVGPPPTVNAVTTENLVVVAVLDVLALATISVGRRMLPWRRRSAD